MEEPQEIKSVFLDYFQELWGGEVNSVTFGGTVDQWISTVISLMENEDLTKDISWKELLGVVRKLPSDKSPGVL